MASLPIALIKYSYEGNLQEKRSIISPFMGQCIMVGSSGQQKLDAIGHYLKERALNATLVLSLLSPSYTRSSTQEMVLLTIKVALPHRHVQRPTPRGF